MSWLGWSEAKDESEARERLARIEPQLRELQETSGAPPPGAAPVEIVILAAWATEETVRILDEALELQRQHQEREAIERLLSACDHDLALPAQVQLHILAGNGYLNLSDLEQAEERYQEAIRLAKQAREDYGMNAALGNLGLVYHRRGDLDRAEEHYRKALVMHYRLLGARLGQALDLGNLGNIYKDRGDFDGAEKHYRRSLAIHRKIGYRPGEADQLSNLDLLAERRGDTETASPSRR